MTPPTAPPPPRRARSSQRESARGNAALGLERARSAGGSWPARVGGAGFAALVGALGAVRRGRPFHPQGVVRTAHLVWDAGGAAPELAYDGPALVRVSRGVGLPRGWPDLPGLAVRWVSGGETRDVLLSATGLGRLTRFALAPRRRPWPGPYGSLMPFRTGRGPVLLGAFARARDEHDEHDERSGGAGGGGLGDDEVRVRLAVASPLGRWRTAGHLLLGPPAGPGEQAVRFDPVLHCPAPWSTYGWAAALRLPAYRTARRTR
mgnify:CR=1 FL=1